MPNYEIYAQHPFNSKAEANKLAGILRKQAVSMKTGALVDVVPDGDAWVVRVWYPVDKDDSKNNKKKRK